MSPLVRVEKRKWDGSLSAAVDEARLVPAPTSAVAWFVPTGSERVVHGEPERLSHDELWVTVPGEWWVLCAKADRQAIVDLILHAAAPVEIADVDAADLSVIAWIDLDLDFEVHGKDITLEDEAQFHEHAATMAYPTDVIRGAWSGISRLAPRYTTREWPFDGWLEQELAVARAQVAAERPDRD